MPPPAPKYFKAWIIFFAIATIGGFFVGAFFGAIAGGIMGVARIELGTIKIVCGALGFVLGVPLSYFTYRWTVSEFIVKELTQAPPPVIPPTSTPVAGITQSIG